jgi:chromosome segregation protein
MLQRLELVGFKSFAEKTRFEFAPGITAIVGPNGSGKSNVVDAVKWVLGEQSAKALRGGEMTDVIFNGSSTRRSIGMAEVSLTFDNARKLLATDALEVTITRRVYRDGEGEYLLNGQNVRLKDIKDLFLGSGAGQGAYSVIEQGRVDALLMASPKDRRAIFEEAAGISRFKAKKLETLRKLDRVDADLVRVKDILSELEKQLGTLRLQASKAQKHREYSAELRRLRVGLARRDYRDLTETIERESEELRGLQAAVHDADEQSHRGEHELDRLEHALAALDAERRTLEAERAEARQTLVGLEATIKYERIQSTGLETELHRTGKQRIELAERRNAVEREILGTDAEAARGETTLAEHRERVATAAAALAGESERIRELQAGEHAERQKLLELAGQVARLQADGQRLRADAATAEAERRSNGEATERLAGQVEESEHHLEQWIRAESAMAGKLADARQNRGEYEQYREQLAAKVQAVRGELEQLRERRSDANGRAEVLEGLERSYEGLGAGVGEVLRKRREGDPFLNSALGGLVGELLQAPRDAAALVDLALGESARCFAVRSERDARAAMEYLGGVPGRIGLIPMKRSSRADVPSPRLSESVSVGDPEWEPLAEQLLGNVAVVPSLESVASSRSYRCITPAGELLEPDGRIAFGPVHAEAGIVSRRSELRELRDGIASFDRRIAEREAVQSQWERQLAALDGPVRTLETEIDALEHEAAEIRTQLRDQKLAHDRLVQSLQHLGRERECLDRLHRQGAAALEGIAKELAGAEQRERETRERLAALEASVVQAEAVRETRRSEHTVAQVSYERAKEHLAGVGHRRTQLDEERARLREDWLRLETSALAGNQRLRESRLATLRATSAAAETTLRKEELDRALHAIATRLHALRAERDRWQRIAQQSRSSTAERKERAHAHEMLVRDLVHRRDTIAARLNEDYSIDIADESKLPDSGEIPDPETAEETIDDLRKKLARLGGVNQESLDELEGLEKREAELRAQHDDLADSHKTLGEIIAQLNDDSRKLFTETLAAVKVHFQELFRKLFAGGQADIVLDEQVDPLESGIEVVARPPGKELRSISLLSGGERTMTAIALLLAIFRSKPSPFCLLDEVDAALDEANTARLAGALGEFLDRSQFIVITHKKRTMAVADVLYGVTMQESGVSKQVSVRFEDWPDEDEVPQKMAA